MKTLLLSLLAVSSTAASTTDRPLLVFDFPDGVRGGHGNIQGLGAWDHRSEQSNANLVRKIRNCGAIDPKFKFIVSHRYHVFSKSGPNDFSVAECVKRVLPNHFSVGLWTEKPGNMGPVLDQGPFMALWNLDAPRRVRAK